MKDLFLQTVSIQWYFYEDEFKEVQLTFDTPFRGIYFLSIARYFTNLLLEKVGLNLFFKHT